LPLRHPLTLVHYPLALAGGPRNELLPDDAFFFSLGIFLAFCSGFDHSSPSPSLPLSLRSAGFRSLRPSFHPATYWTFRSGPRDAKRRVPILSPAFPPSAEPFLPVQAHDILLSFFPPCVFLRALSCRPPRWLGPICLVVPCVRSFPKKPAFNRPLVWSSRGVFPKFSDGAPEMKLRFSLPVSTRFFFLLVPCCGSVCVLFCLLFSL